MSTNAKNARHISVLLNEVLQALIGDILALREKKRDLWFLDGTLGLAGHSKSLLEVLKKEGLSAKLCGLDRDPQALSRAHENLTFFSDSCFLFQSDYASYQEVLPKITSSKDDITFTGKFDGILLDLGISSLQLDIAERGFSYHHDGPLNMRMDMLDVEKKIKPSFENTRLKSSPYAGNAKNFIEQTDLVTLRRVIEEFGEDPQANRIANAIIEERQKAPITSTKQLADIIFHAYPPKWRASARNHPATRTFQAIRMYINDELGQLSSFLDNILEHTADDGIIAIISFHSLEDRLVKQKFKEWSMDCICPAHIPKCVCHHKKVARLINKKPILPSKEECLINPRASSAKLRVAQKLGKEASLKNTD